MTSLKVLICGDGAIGKTCLLDTLCEKDVIDWDSPEYKPTAADTLQRQWQDVDGGDWDVTLWDTAGQEALVNLREAAYPGTEVLLIGFDMTKGVSLENVPTWVEEVNTAEPAVGAIIVVGTKSDWYNQIKASGKGSDGQVLKTVEQMYEMAVQIGAHAFVCTSAKDGYGLLENAEEGSAVGADPDTMSGQDSQYLDMQILRCAKVYKDGGSVEVLESRAAKPEEKKPEPKPVAPVAPPVPVAPKPVEPKPVAPVAPEPAKQKPDGQKEDGCCTLL